jgi:hypothetical protein
VDGALDGRIADAVLGPGKWVPPRLVVMVEAVVDVGREWMASLLRFGEGIAREWHNLGSLRVVNVVLCIILTDIRRYEADSGPEPRGPRDAAYVVTCAQIARPTLTGNCSYGCLLS